jgi:hypothetical protein
MEDFLDGGEKEMGAAYSQAGPIYLGQQLSSQSDVSTCVRVSI